MTDNTPPDNKPDSETPKVFVPLEKELKSPSAWHKIPRILNAIQYHLSTDSSQVLDYEPLHLKIFSNVRYTLYEPDYEAYLKKENVNKLVKQLTHTELDLNGFKLALEQVPSVRSIEFTGRGEHMQNPELFSMIRFAYQHTDAQISMDTDGLLIKKNLDNILNNGLYKLTVRLYAHRPSSYYQMSGLDSRQFVEAEKQAKLLLDERNQRQQSLKVALMMVVDDHHYLEAPDMIAFAKKSGADELILKNYVQINSTENSDRTLYTDQKEVIAFFDELKSKNDPEIKITWPVLMERSAKTNRNCTDPFQMVGVDGQCNVTPCSRQAFEFEDNRKIWDPDFWNSPAYQWLRGVHGDTLYDVPLPCQHCTNNISTPSS